MFSDGKENREMLFTPQGVLDTIRPAIYQPPPGRNRLECFRNLGGTYLRLVKEDPIQQGVLT